MDFAVPVDHIVELKGEKKELWKMKVTVIPIGIGGLGTIPKGLVKGMKDLEEVSGQEETIQTTEL